MKFYRVWAGFLLIILLTSCGIAVQAASAPTLQPTETALPLATPTLLPSSTPAALPAVRWEDVSLHRQAMKPGFAHEVDRLGDVNRYLIVATLSLEPESDVHSAVIRGAQRVRYTNRASVPLSLLIFRLYPNTPALGGRMNVTYVSVNGRQVEPSVASFSSLMGVPLETPLQPGESVEVKLDFNVVMERGLNTSYGRFGYVNDVVSATSWYPTLSVYDEGEGWWMDIPVPQGDPAYTETGLYDVRLTVPGDMVVAMSGLIVETQRNPDGTVTYRDVTGPMRDHAFQASARYMITPLEVDGTRINLVHYKDQALSPTDGTALAGRYAATALAVFNQTFGEYPYRELDVVQNPTPSGVEYPGLIQIAERSWVRGHPFLERVIVHEIGHQWFYALVGNNQVAHPWLDESLTSYTEFVYMRAAYPEDSRAEAYINDFQERYTGYTGAGQPDLPLDLPVRRFTGFSYGAIVYTKGPLFFVELERLMGRETVYEALAEYVRQHKYGIVRSIDVKNAFEDVSGRDLTAVFQEWVGGFVN